MKHLKQYENFNILKKTLMGGDYIMTTNYDHPMRIAYMPDKGDRTITTVPFYKEFKVKNSIDIPLENVIRKLTDEEVELFLISNKYNL